VAHPDDSPIRDDSIQEIPIVAILDYSGSYAEEVSRCLTVHEVDVYVTSNWAMCLSADGLIIPGGDSPQQMARELQSLRGAELVDARLIANRSVLAVGAAFNLLFENESNSEPNVFNQWPGASNRIDSIAVPQWFEVEGASESVLFRDFASEKFLFEVPLFVTEWKLDAQGPLTAPKVSWVNSAEKPSFIAAVENGPLVATQFYPHSSNDSGARLLANWIKSL
jgi:glutamine amidotransferase